MSELLVNEISKYDASEVTFKDNVAVGSGGATKALTVTGNATFNGAVDCDTTLNVDGNATLKGTTNCESTLYFGAGTSYGVTNAGSATLSTLTVGGETVGNAKMIGVATFTMTLAASTANLSSVLSTSTAFLDPIWTIDSPVVSTNTMQLSINKSGSGVSSTVIVVPTFMSANGTTRISGYSHSSGTVTLTYGNTAASSDTATLVVAIWTNA
jgi:hypothetical protein